MEMLEVPDGLYSAYLAARGGEGFALLVFNNGLLAGADAGGTRFDGPYTIDAADHTVWGSLKVQAPPNTVLLQGVPTGERGISYDIPFRIPTNFGELPYVTLATPFGPINVRFKKIRDMP